MAELHEDRQRALSFGAIAADYDRLRPRYENFENKPLFIMTSDY